MNNIPLVDLKAQYLTIKREMDEAIQATIDDAAFIMGDRVQAFEEAFAAFCGAKFGVGCSSGTTALHLAFLACGVGDGDEVIVPSHTFVATAEAVCHCGAVPVFADVDAETYCMDIGHVESLTNEKTRAVCPVHIYGQCADMDPLLELARKRNLKVVEDCAQSHGAEYKGRRVGALGDCGAFSFFPGKNLGAYGDGGMVTTNDENVANRLRMLVNHGRIGKYEHTMIGYNYRLDALQAAVLSVKLRHLTAWTKARQARADRYTELLRDLPVQTPIRRFGHVYHLYVVQRDNRDALASALKSRGVATGVHYPIPLHLQPCFRHLPTAGRGKLPVTEKLVNGILSLPIFPELTDEQQDRVAQGIRAHIS